MLRSTVRGTKLFYALTSLLVGIAACLLPIETKGRSLEVGFSNIIVYMLQRVHESQSLAIL